MEKKTPAAADVIIRNKKEKMFAIRQLGSILNLDVRPRHRSRVSYIFIYYVKCNFFTAIE